MAVADCVPNDDGRAGLGHELRESILVRELAYRNLREFRPGTSPDYFLGGAFAASTTFRSNGPLLSARNTHSDAGSHAVVCR